MKFKAKLYINTDINGGKGFQIPRSCRTGFHFFKGNSGFWSGQIRYSEKYDIIYPGQTYDIDVCIYWGKSFFYRINYSNEIFISSKPDHVWGKIIIPDDEIKKIKQECKIKIITEILPKEIIQKGFITETNDIAFYAKEIFQIIEILKNNNIAILGGNVFVKIDNVIKYSSDSGNWHCDMMLNESFKDFQKKSLKTTINYLNNLSRKDDYLYNLIPIEESEF